MTGTFKKNSTETVEDFICRVISCKKDLGMTWDDIANICNSELGYHFGESYYRKKYTKRVLEDTFNTLDEIEDEKGDAVINKQATNTLTDSINFDNTFPPISEEEFLAMSAQEQTELYQSVSQQLRELTSLKTRIADERNYNNFVLRRISREDSLKDIALSVAEKMNKEKTLVPVEPTDVVKSNRPIAGILQISDWHYGIMIDNYWNHFEPETVKERVQKLANEVVSRCKARGISELYVAELGDMIAGRIHAQIRIQSRYDVMTQLFNVTEILTELLAELSKHFEKVHFYNCLDNHSRIEPNKKESLNLESLARCIPWYLEPRLKEFKNIDIASSEFGMDIISFNCLGHHIGGVHGDKDKPNSVVSNLTLYTKKRFDMILTAHLHHFSCDEKDDTLVVSNGSLMGTDGLAEDLRLNSKPSQNFIVVSEDNVAEEIHRIIL